MDCRTCQSNNKYTDIVILLFVVIVVVLLSMMYMKICKIESQITNIVSEKLSLIEGTPNCSCKSPSVPGKIDQINNIGFVPPPQNLQKTIVTLFYTPWCNYSKQFFPIWETVKNVVKDSNINDKIVFEQYDCDNNKEICKNNNVPGFPFINLKKPNGIIIEYPGSQPRSLEFVVKFINENVA